MTTVFYFWTIEKLVIFEHSYSLVAQMVKNLPECKRPGFDAWVGEIPWRRAWYTTPIFLPGESHGQKSLVGYTPWSHKTWTVLYFNIFSLLPHVIWSSRELKYVLIILSVLECNLYICVCVYICIYVCVCVRVCSILGFFRAQLKWNYYLIMTICTFLILLISLPNTYSKWFTFNFVLLFSKALFILN